MATSKKKKKRRRPRRPSVFFIWLKALFLSATVFVFGLAFELFISSLLPVWQQSLSYSLLWILPGLFAVSTFLETVVDRSWFSVLVWVGLCVGLAFSMNYVYKNPPAQIAQLRMLRDHTRQKANQQQAPLISNTVRQPASEVPLYFEEIEGQSVLSQADQQQIAQIINNLPSLLKEKAAGVYFLSRESFRKQHSQDFEEEIAGFTQMENATIVIKVRLDEARNYRSLCKDGSSIALDDPYSYQETLVHEFTHLLDIQTKGETACLSDRADWIDLYNRYQYSLGNYASTSPIEFFAEAGVYYYLYPHLLYTISPEIYNWFTTYALANTNILARAFFVLKK